MTNRAAVTNAVQVLSVNGPEVTVISGRHAPTGRNGDGDGAVRCVYLGEGSVLSGFTLTNGATRAAGDIQRERSGGGVWCASANATVTNCVISGNSAADRGGGAYHGVLKNSTLTTNWTGFSGGGAYESALDDCTLTANGADDSGGGVYAGTLTNCSLNSNWSSRGGGAAGGTLNSCTLIGNTAPSGGGAFYAALNYCTLSGNGGTQGGGAFGGTLTHCTLSGNSSSQGGGAFGGTLTHCSLIGNSAGEFGGGASSDDYNFTECLLTNCTLIGNSAFYGGGAYGGGAYGGNYGLCTLHNCTLSSNLASFQGGGAYQAVLNNCIVYYNSASSSGDNCDPNSTLNYCCTTPLPNQGVGSITNEPAFLNLAAGNLRLQSNSPCINAGRNALASGGTDLDDLPRIAGGTVDIGAYEFQSPVSLLSYAWLQQYGLPLDGSADTSDPDGDQFTNYQEWRAGTDPTNAFSLLRLFVPARLGSNLVLRWESVPGRSYELESSTNLGWPPQFLPLAKSLGATPDTNVTTFIHKNAAAFSPWFYRLIVEE